MNRVAGFGGNGVSPLRGLGGGRPEQQGGTGRGSILPILNGFYPYIV